MAVHTMELGVVINVLFQAAPQSQWYKRAESLILDEFSERIHFKSMGLPMYRQKHPLWT